MLVEVSLTRIPFQSTPSAWRETRRNCIGCYAGAISIHSLRMEGDDHYNWLYATLDGISIHSLRMEGDAQRSSHTPDRRYFNPLPPHGGRLCNTLFRSFCVPYFNPLPPHGGRHPACHTAQGREDFNPLPPHGGRRSRNVSRRRPVYFNPLPPHGGRQAAVRTWERSE